MSERILEKLEPVRRRQLGLEIMRSAAVGLLASSLVGVGLGLVRWQGAGITGASRWWLWAALIAVAGPALGAIVGLVRGRSARLAAAAVDRQYGLKDRALSAVDFIRRGKSSALFALQVADAEEHLALLDPRQVAPFKLPAVLPYAVAAMALALVLLLWPRAGIVKAEPAAPLEAVLAAAEDAEDSVEELNEAAKKDNDIKLKELVQKLSESIQDMKLPGVDTKEALAKLSEMQAAITAQQAQFNVGLVDAQMQSLGEAMASTQALEGAGQALQQGKYDKAAEQLEKAEPKFDRKETKTLKEKLAQAAKAMEDGGLTELSTATTELAESLDDEATAQGACKKLGNLARSQGRRKRISDLLTLATHEVSSECKSNCDKNSTRQASLAQEVGEALPATGAWASAATPTVIRPSSIPPGSANRSKDRWGKGTRKPSRPICPKAGKPLREPTASSIRNTAA